MGTIRKMKVFGGVLASAAAFSIRSDVNIDGTGQTVLLNENVFMPRDTPACFYTPGQVESAAGCTVQNSESEKLCPALLPNFAGSDISNQIPNNGQPGQFCDNMYADWYGPLTELRLFCNNGDNYNGGGSVGEVRGVQGRYGPKPGGNTYTWGPTHGTSASAPDVHMEA